MSPLKICYKGRKVNWIDTIYSDKFFVHEVTTMMKELGYENVSMVYYYKKANNVLVDNDVDDIVEDVGEDELENVIENLEGENKYKNLGDNQNVDDKNENKNVDNVDWQQPSDMSNNFEFFFSKVNPNNELGQSSRNDKINVKVDNNSDEASQYNSNSGHEVYMAEFRRNIYANIERFGCKENVEKVNEVFEDEEVSHKDFDSGSETK
ncbi:hypothetical protein Tco_0983029 [Tanacetum coccineum]